MRTVLTCSWCHAGVDAMPGGGPTFCPECGHRADVARLDCDCTKCESQAAAWEMFLRGEQPEGRRP